MGLVDKVKEQAGQLAEKAQHGVEQGKHQLEERQAQKRGEALLRDLGAACWAQRRHAGPPSAVDDALLRLDRYVAEHGEPTTHQSIDITGTP